MVVTGVQRSKGDAAADVLPVPIVSLRKAEPHLALAVAIPGWLRTADDAIGVWKGYRPKDATAYSLVWETSELLSLNVSIVQMIKDKVSANIQYAAPHGRPVVCHVASVRQESVMTRNAALVQQYF